MKAAVEHSRRAVWGVGRTSAAAIADARHWMQLKSHIQVGPLEAAKLSADADLTQDGEKRVREGAIHLVAMVAGAQFSEMVDG